jgi:hypothetical protein
VARAKHICTQGRRQEGGKAGRYNKAVVKPDCVKLYYGKPYCGKTLLQKILQWQILLW